MAKITESKVTSIVDRETGEISLIETEKVYTIPTQGEEFIQLYFRLIAGIYSLKSANDIKILIKLCEIAKYNTGEVSISTADRESICKELEIFSSNFSKSMSRLKDRGLITGERGTYILNPAIFWKGEQRIRKQLLKEGAMSVIVNFTGMVEDKKVLD